MIDRVLLFLTWGWQPKGKFACHFFTLVVHVSVFVYRSVDKSNFICIFICFMYIHKDVDFSLNLDIIDVSSGGSSTSLAHSGPSCNVASLITMDV